MKHTILAITSLCFALGVGTALAQVGSVNAPSQVKEARGVLATTTNNNNNATSASQVRVREENRIREENRLATSSNSQGELHRSDVAKFVQSLLSLANRGGGIGEQVRKIANEQASSTETMLQAMERAEERGALRTFLFGADYKNLGIIRSEMVKTNARLDQLARELEKIGTSTTKEEVLKEIETLKSDQASLDLFVSANENKFSLFGWAAKIFR